MKLYSDWPSTTSNRVGAALNLRGLAHDTVPLDLVVCNQRAPDDATLNAGKGVQTLGNLPMRLPTNRFARK